MREVAPARSPVGPKTGPSLEGPRRIAVMPVYNEEATVIGVLERLAPLVDEIVVVVYGSTDRSRDLIFAWAEDRPNVHPIFFNRNRGMSAAYYAAFSEMGRRVLAGQKRPCLKSLIFRCDGQRPR